MTQAVAKHMVEAKEEEGCIINISSIVGKASHSENPGELLYTILTNTLATTENLQHNTINREMFTSNLFRELHKLNSNAKFNPTKIFSFLTEGEHFTRAKFLIEGERFTKVK